MSGLPQLWAPWRSHYITRHPVRGCIFCRAWGSRRDRENHLIHRGRRVFAVLNLYPYNNGHVMIAPKRHVGDLGKISAPEWAEMLAVVQKLLRRIQRNLQPHGYNVGVNVGRAAGAGIPGHLHLHLVPRWIGDTNFMPALGATKVISQSLDEIYRRLADRTVRHGSRD